MIVNHPVQFFSNWRMGEMGDKSTDDSSDDSFSYKNTAKRAFEIAKKRIAAVKPTAEATQVLDLSSDSDGGCKKCEKASASIDEGQKRKRVSRCVNTKSKRSRTSRARGGRGEKIAGIVTGLTSNTIGLPLVISTASLTSKPLSDSCPKAVVTVSDSSDVELLSASDVAVVSEGEERSNRNELMSVKISWKFQPIQKFQLRRHQKFKVLMEHFSKLEDVPLQQIVIYGGKDNCRLIEPYDTPDTVGITVTDILEGGVLMDGGQMRAQRLRGLAEQNGDGITLRVQLEGVRSFPVRIGPQQKMQVLMVKVAEQMEVDVSRVRLFLDGEAINSESIAKDLDMEEGDVLDLRLL